MFYYKVRQAYHLEGYGKWIIQLRGGSDLTLRRHDPEFKEEIRQVLMDCPQNTSLTIVPIYTMLTIWACLKKNLLLLCPYRERGNRRKSSGINIFNKAIKARTYYPLAKGLRKPLVESSTGIRGNSTSLG